MRQRPVLSVVVYLLMMILPFLALGWHAVYTAIKIARAQQSVADWRATDGDLLEARHGRRNELEVRYSYRIGDQEFVSDRFSLVPVSTSKYWTIKTLDSLRDTQEQGGSITVYYDPSEPSSSVLYVAWDPVWITLFGGAFAFFVAVVMSWPFIYAAFLGRSGLLNPARLRELLLRRLAGGPSPSPAKIPPRRRSRGRP